MCSKWIMDKSCALILSTKSDVSYKLATNFKNHKNYIVYFTQNITPPELGNCLVELGNKIIQGEKGE